MCSLCKNLSVYLGFVHLTLVYVTLRQNVFIMLKNEQCILGFVYSLTSLKGRSLLVEKNKQFLPVSVADSLTHIGTAHIHRSISTLDD